MYVDRHKLIELQFRLVLGHELFSASRVVFSGGERIGEGTPRKRFAVWVRETMRRHRIDQSVLADGRSHARLACLLQHRTA